MRIKIKKCDCESCKGARSLEISAHLGPVCFRFDFGPGFKELPFNTYLMIDIWEDTLWLWDISYHGRSCDDDECCPDFKPHWDIDILRYFEAQYFEKVPGTTYLRMISASEKKAKANEQFVKDYEKRTGRKL